MMAAVTLARDTEVHPSLIRLTKHVGDFYSPLEIRPRPLMEIFSSWTDVRLETWADTAARSIHVVRGTTPRSSLDQCLAHGVHVRDPVRIPRGRTLDRPHGSHETQPTGLQQLVMA